MAILKNTITILIFLYVAIAARSQDTIVLHAGAGWDSTYDMNLHTEFYVDVTNTEKIKTITTKQFHYDSNFRANMLLQYKNRFITAWMRWTIYNPSVSSERVLLLYNRVSFCLCM